MQKLYFFLFLWHTVHICAMEYALDIPDNATPMQVLQICIKEAQNNNFWKNLFVHPPANVPLNQTLSAMPHNAYASKNKGYKYHQQTQNLEQQFVNGARGAMLDIHINSEEQKAHPLRVPELMLAHTNGPGDNMTIRTGPFHFKYGTAEPVLETSKKYAKLLTIYRNRPFFINLEDDVTGDATTYKEKLTTLIKKSGLTDMVVRQQDLKSFFTKNSPHSTFPSRKDLGTRHVFITDDTRSGDDFFYSWKLFKENNFSTLDLNEIIQERSSSKNADGNDAHKLYIMNFFPFASVYEVDGPKVVKYVAAKSINLLEHLPYFGATLKDTNISTIPLTDINEKLLPEALKYAFNTKGSMFYHRLPNFIATDNYTSDSFLFALCNICNSLTPEQREKLFGKSSAPWAP